MASIFKDNVELNPIRVSISSDVKKLPQDNLRVKTKNARRRRIDIKHAKRTFVIKAEIITRTINVNSEISSVVKLAQSEQINLITYR